MPHPGLKVVTNPTFDGRLSEIESDFKKHLLELVPLVLSPRNLVVQQIGGQKVKAKELVHYFKAYTAIYKGNELPEPKSMLEATAEANNLSAVSAAKDSYTQSMEEVCGGKRPYLSTATLKVEHVKSKKKALEAFNSRRKMGGEEFSLKYVENLEREMEDLYSNFRSHNEGKNIMKSARTPGVLFVIAAICYVLSGIFGIMGMYSFANMFNLIMGVMLILLAMWAYVRYSGDYREVSTRIDSFANVVWDYALKPISAKLMAKGIQSATNEMLGDSGMYRSKSN
jgi:atlastin